MLFKEIVAKSYVDGRNAHQEGEFIRLVSLSQNEANILNGLIGNGSTHRYRYEKHIEEEKVNEKDVRKSLFEEAKSLGLTPMKNIDTQKLKELVGNAVARHIDGLKEGNGNA
jgi:hypothetical protein